MPLETTPQIRFAAPRRAVVVLGAWFMRTVVRLPVRWQLCLGKALGTLARVALPGRRRVAARNIALCFPDLTEAERQRLVVEHFRALGASLVEMAMGWFGDERTIARLVRIEGREHLDAALARGRGVILFTAHFTAFELFSPVLATLCPRLCGMYKAQRNPAMNELMNRGRGRHFDVLFTKDNVREMLRALADNAVVWYAADQSYGRKGSALLPFLGEPAMTNTAISRIARVSGAAVLPYFGRRLPDDSGYEMTFGAPLPDLPSDDPIGDTARLMAVIEEYVRVCPEQYWWIHKRFKGRPPPYPDPYD